MGVRTMKIFLSVLLSFCFLPSVSYSSDTIMGIARDKASKYIQSLHEGNYEAYYELRQSLDKYGAEEQKEIKKAMKKAFKSTHGNGDNILHLIVRLGDSEAFKQIGDSQALFPDIKLVYDVLGPKLFLKLLKQKNNQKVSPAQKALLSGGLAREALEDFLGRYIFSFYTPAQDSPYTGLIIGLIAGGSTLAYMGMFGDDSGLTAAGLSMLAGAGACYIPFMNKEIAFYKALESLTPL